MREKIATFLGFSFIGAFVCVFLANAVPPSPPVSGLTSASSVAITGGNITGITTLGATNATLTSANITTTDIDGGAIDGTAIGANSASTGAFTTLSATGSLTFPIVEKSGTGNLSAAECTGTIINIYGQTDDMTLTLPTAFAGGSFRIQVSAAVAKYIRIDPNGSEVQSFDGQDLTGGYYVYLSSATKGAMIQYVAIKTGASTWQWCAMTMVGQWYVQTS